MVDNVAEEPIELSPSLNGRGSDANLVEGGTRAKRSRQNRNGQAESSFAMADNQYQEEKGR